jgi:pimeloyl-ACP methyl ester carboxylesterase
LMGTPERRTFQGVGVRLAGDVLGDPSGTPVLLLHGGGQTRHSWSAAQRALARRGYLAVSIDFRGHGDSEWSVERDYRMSMMKDDVLAVIDQLPALPVLVGASMGGIASLLAVGETTEAVAHALVLVDITPRVERSGIARIQAFMSARPDGFATLDEAADAVAAYNPDRPRSPDPSGLLKNLRLRDGRYFWHWDPAFMEQPDVRHQSYFERLEAACPGVNIPTLLIRGGKSEIVSDATVAHMKELIPHARFVDVTGAGHMVAGDRNDIFNAAVFAFLDELDLQRRATV